MLAAEILLVAVWFVVRIPVALKSAVTLSRDGKTAEFG